MAIDPGPKTSGVVWYTRSDGKVHACHKERPNDELLEDLVTFQAGWADGPVVCEMVASYGMAVGADVFETVRWIGRFEQRARDKGMRFEVVYRLAVKVHLCHDSRAKGKNIRQAILDRYLASGYPAAQGTKKNPGPLYGVSDHAWSALAIAITWGDQNP